MFDEIAKPMPVLKPVSARIILLGLFGSWPIGGVKMAVLMPITRPLRSTKGPPELPGLIEASVWRKSS